MRGFLEREVKLDPGPDFVLPDLSGVPLEDRVFTSTYFDTPPRSLGRSGITLRRRVENGRGRWQLKLPRDDGRDELEAAGDDEAPPAELTALLVVHLRHGQLERVATLRTHRSGVRLIEGDRSLAEVTIDAVDILAGGQEAGTFTELEVELIDGHPADLDRLARILRHAGARRSEGLPKVLRVLELHEEPAPAADAPDLAHVRFLLAEQLRELERHDPGVRVGRDPEAVHRLRVATRRARALIRTTRPLLGDSLGPLAEELKWLTGSLGPVRDLDVLLARLRPEAARLDVDRSGGQEIVAALEAERARARAELLDALNEPRYLSLLRTFANAVATIPAVEAETRVEELAAAAFAQLRKAADRLPRDPADEDLHRFRIRGKRARYAAELAQVRGDRAIERFVASVKELQDVIGEHQDAVVAEERIRSVAVTSTAATSAGRLIERERLRRLEMRAVFPRVLAAVLDRGRKAFS